MTERRELEPHQACAMMPRQSAEEFAALRASIRAGWNSTHPIVLYEDKILDGRHRYEACVAEGITPTFVKWEGAAFDWNPYKFVRVEHEARRNWTSQQQKYLVLSKVIKREGVFDEERRRIAEEANARRSDSARGNQNARKPVSENSGGPSTPTTVLTDAASEPSESKKKSRKQHKARKAKAAATGTTESAVRDGDKIESLAHELGMPEMVEQVMSGEIAAHAALKSLEEQKRAQELARPVEIALPDGVHRGDFRELAAQIPDESVELVFTDPPYDADSVELYEAAAREAARILRPGGSMIAYTGQRHLPAVLAGMSKHLRYWWTIAGVHDGGNQLMNKLGVRVGWKPLVWFVKGTRGDIQNVVLDVVRGDREKDSHVWQQAQTEAEYYIRELCSQNGVVVDFFLGGGTTMAAARALGRRCIAFEIDAGAIERAARRLSA